MQMTGPYGCSSRNRSPRRIAAGVYSVGERLPSVRELAADAGVNPNTMQRAMADLKIRGWW